MAYYSFLCNLKGMRTPVSGFSIRELICFRIDSISLSAVMRKHFLFTFVNIVINDKTTGWNMSYEKVFSSNFSFRWYIVLL